MRKSWLSCGSFPPKGEVFSREECAYVGLTQRLKDLMELKDL
jgi:hypothetical protein